ncbi:hypothetical protein EB796_016520 [Bugula neritina]|uniref:Uncharacterized protein n=1 Tax=Bugula neritina TaxID=10212 RepID=A0A7J7JH73_BUGNE|nr:hypothetical protein EB796_016520 [Bugula neritina]
MANLLRLFLTVAAVLFLITRGAKTVLKSLEEYLAYNDPVRFGKRDYKEGHDKPGFYMNRETTTPSSLNYPAYSTPTPQLPSIFGKLFPKLRSRYNHV